MEKNFFDDLSVTLSKTAKELSNKAEGFVGKQKIRGQILAEERAAERALAVLGKVIYDRYTDGAELEDDLVDLCTDVKNHYDKIAALKESAAEKSNKKICPSCGKNMVRDAAFCPYCGTAYPEPETTEEDEIIEVVNEDIEEISDAVEDAVEEVKAAVEEVKAVVEEIVEEAAEDSSETEE